MTRVLLALALSLGLGLAGCIFSGGPEDLSPVCERKTTTPWNPYAPEQLASLTTVDSGVPNATRDALLTAASYRILTQGGTAYAAFHATLSPDGEAAWRFAATGNTTLGDDHYDVLISRNDTAIPAQVDAPETLRTIAWNVANRTAETNGAATRGALLGASWERALPGCVEIAFSSRADAEPTVITVGFDLYRVVHVSGPRDPTFS